MPRSITLWRYWRSRGGLWMLPRGSGTNALLAPPCTLAHPGPRAVCRIMAEIGLDAGSGQDGVLVENFWESFRLDPRQAGNASMRASDADRELVRAVLADAYG